MHFKVREGVYQSDRARAARDGEPDAVAIQTDWSGGPWEQLDFPWRRKLVVV
jgi:hypothetical protein